MSEAADPMQKVITKCWEDEAFKARLLADPATTLRAEGVQVPEGVTVTLVVDTEGVRTLVIPPAPGAVRLVEEDLSDIAVAGASWEYVDADSHTHLWTGSGSFIVDAPVEPGSPRYSR